MNKEFDELCINTLRFLAPMLFRRLIPTSCRALGSAAMATLWGPVPPLQPYDPDGPETVLFFSAGHGCALPYYCRT
jgi:hypothetical protein